MHYPHVEGEARSESADTREGAEAYTANENRNPIKAVLRLGPLFNLVVLLPTILAGLYFGIFASDVYVSESEFVVRSPDKPSMSGLGVLLKSTGFSSGSDEIFASQSYIVSRDALRSVNKSNRFLNAYSAKGISFFDKFNPLGFNGSFEELYHYYQNKVQVEHDNTSSITTLTVRAYTAKDAQAFNDGLLKMAEKTVNDLNERGRQDLIRIAQTEVDSAKAKARAAALALAAYRNQEGVIDPEKQASAQLQMISKLQDELILTKTRLREIRHAAPENPQIEILATRADEIQKEISEQLGQVAGGPKSLSSTAAQYERVAFDAQYAEKALAAAIVSLEEAKGEARRKQAYVERIVQPNLPDEPIEPRRLRGIFATLALSLLAWGILTMLIAGAKEHID